MTTLFLYDRWGGQLGALKDVLSAKRKWSLNGEHTLTVTAAGALSKGQRIVYLDGRGGFREFVVSETVEGHESGAVVTTAVCEDSIAELLGDYLVEREPNGTALTCLRAALSSSRWEAGDVDVAGSRKLSFYHMTAREAVNEVVSSFGGELSTTVEVENGAVVRRLVNVVSRVGADNGKRFTCRKDLVNVVRTVEMDDAVTALYGYGKGLESVDGDGEPTGGYGRKLTFGSVNGGLDYVADAEALEAWGRPDGKGGKAHVFGKVEFDDCEDPNELLGLTRKALDDMKAPRVSYKATTVGMAAAGLDADAVGDGDTVTIVDEVFDPPLRLSGRCLEIEEDLLDSGNTVVTLGNIVQLVTDTIIEQGQALQGLQSHSASWDGAASVSESYINALVKRLNEEFDSAGSYQYTGFEIGTIWSSVPLDENFKPTRRPASAIQLVGGGFRIADSVKSNGEFDWRSFGTGEGFTADCITAGTIRGGANSWNLGTGDLKFKQGGIEINGPSNTRVVIDAASGFKVYQNSSFIGGIEIMSGKAHMRAARAGTSSNLYMTTGQTKAGNPGTSFVNSYGNYLDVEALRAIDDTSGKTTGVGMACFDKPFMHVSDYYDHVWLHPPTYANTYLEQPPQQVYVGTERAKVCLSEDKGFFVGEGYAMLKFDATHYVRIDSDGVQCRCGSKGFGWVDGHFAESLVWS